MKTDRRVLKTEQALESALLKLMRGKSFDQTPEELARKVGTIVDNAVAAFLPKTEI